MTDYLKAKDDAERHALEMRKIGKRPFPAKIMEALDKADLDLARVMAMAGGRAAADAVDAAIRAFLERGK